MTKLFTAEEKYREALREVTMRKDVYGRNAPDGKMFPAQQRRIELMQEIADDYAELMKKERLL